MYKYDSISIIGNTLNGNTRFDMWKWRKVPSEANAIDSKIYHAFCIMQTH